MLLETEINMFLLSIEHFLSDVRCPRYLDLKNSTNNFLRIQKATLWLFDQEKSQEDNYLTFICRANFILISRLPLKVVFHHRLSSSKGCLSSKVVLQQRFSSIEGRLPSKAVNYHLVAPDVLWTALIPMHYGLNRGVM